MKKYAIIFFLFGSLLMIYVMAKTGATLKTAATPLGILNLEFAYNINKTSVVLNAWAPGNGTNNIAAAKTNTYFDFIFLFFYAILLFLACKKIAQLIKGPVFKAGNIIATGALLAGLFDILENIGMLITLNGHTFNSIAFLTSFFSVIKWALAIIAVLYVLSGLLALIFRKAKS